MKEVVFLMNGNIIRHEMLTEEINLYCNQRFDYKILKSAYAGHLKEMAFEAAREGKRNIVVVGGDGSMNEVVNGLVDAFRINDTKGPEAYNWEGIRAIRIGLIPGGSGNDLARTLRVEPDRRKIMDHIEGDLSRPLDIGYARYLDKHKKETERFFVNIADVGMGGETVMHMAEHRINWLSPNLNYMKAIFSGFVNYEKTDARWKTPEKSWSGKVMSVVIANGKFFGSGLGVAPDAEIDDGKFTLVTLGNIKIIDYILNLRHIKAARKVRHKEVFYDTTSSITIEPTGSGDLPIEMDGEFAGFCPLTIDCVPGAISFMV